MISHTEGYIFAIQEEEINTKALMVKREQAKNPEFDKKCRFCHQKAEKYIPTSSARAAVLSASMYLPMRHNVVARVVYNSVIQHHFKDQSYVHPLDIWKRANIELWWDIPITTTPRVKNNKSDIVIWNSSKLTCKIVDICVPLDGNIHTQEKTKIDTYVPLTVGLLRLYPQYNFEVIPLVIGATGLVTDSLMKYPQGIVKLVANMTSESFDWPK